MEATPIGKRSLWERIAHLEPGITVGQWIYDRITNNWPWIVAIFGGGGMTYLASISEWLSQWGPVGYGAAGIVAAIALYTASSLGYLAFGYGRERYAFAEYLGAAISTSHVNVLSPTHAYARIKLSDFYHPFMRPTQSVRFEACELMGPAMVFLEGGTSVNCSFIDCEIVIAREDRGIKGGIWFKNCLFERSKFYRVTFMMNFDHYQNIPQEMRSTVPVISDGRIGDV